MKSQKKSDLQTKMIYETNKFLAEQLPYGTPRKPTKK